MPDPAQNAQSLPRTPEGWLAKWAAEGRISAPVEYIPIPPATGPNARLRDMEDAARCAALQVLIADPQVPGIIADAVQNSPDIGTTGAQTDMEPIHAFKGGGASEPMPNLFDVRPTPGSTGPTVDVFVPQPAVWVYRTLSGTMAVANLSSGTSNGLGWRTFPDLTWPCGIYANRVGGVVELSATAGPIDLTQDKDSRLLALYVPPTSTCIVGLMQQVYRGVIVGCTLVPGDADIDTPLTKTIATLATNGTIGICNRTDSPDDVQTGDAVVGLRNIGGVVTTIPLKASGGGGGGKDGDADSGKQTVQWTIHTLSDGSLGLDLTNSDGDPSSGTTKALVIDGSGSILKLRRVAFTPL